MPGKPMHYNLCQLEGNKEKNVCKNKHIYFMFTYLLPLGFLSEVTATIPSTRMTTNSITYFGLILIIVASAVPFKMLSLLPPHLNWALDMRVSRVS